MSIPGLATSPHPQYEPDALVIRTLLNRKAALACRRRTQGGPKSYDFVRGFEAFLSGSTIKMLPFGFPGLVGDPRMSPGASSRPFHETF